MYRFYYIIKYFYSYNSPRKKVELFSFHAILTVKLSFLRKERYRLCEVYDIARRIHFAKTGFRVGGNGIYVHENDSKCIATLQKKNPTKMILRQTRHCYPSKLTHK